MFRFDDNHVVTFTTLLNAYIRDVDIIGSFIRYKLYGCVGLTYKWLILLLPLRIIFIRSPHINAITTVHENPLTIS